MIQEPLYFQEISQKLGLKVFQVEHVWELHLEGATVPFISRYRQERTGGLDEVRIREILETYRKIESLYTAKKTALTAINELGKLSEDLQENILKAQTLKEVEELYKPFKSKKKTLAMIARENGFQPISKLILQNNSQKDIEKSEVFLSLQKIFSPEEILEGAGHIIAADIAQSSDLRAYLKDFLLEEGMIVSKIKTSKSLEKLNIKDKEQVSKFELYKAFSARISQLKSYQILALNRGEKIGILSIKIEKTPEAFENLCRKYIRILEIHTNLYPLLENAYKMGYDTLFDSLENELRSELDEKAQDDAIESFQKNLSGLLLTKPEYGKQILAIDPGFKAGCKIVVLDSGGNPLCFEKIFLFAKEEALKKLETLLKKYPLEALIVGNGTGSKETLELLKELFEKNIDNTSITTLQDHIFIVNESGASVYSASEVAAEEFPELESLERGTISLGRRYIDPLSELVKIPVGSIGVGMYQHDIAEKKLEEKLGYVVEDVVNTVGINVNTASSYILQYISGIGKVAAKKIYKNRPYTSRKELKKQLSEKVYQQAIGFLRVPESKEFLDTTDIHPEQYPLAKYIIAQKISQEKTEDFYVSHRQEIQKLYSDASPLTLSFIISSLQEAGQEKRVHSSHQKAHLGKQADIKIGDILEGTVRNVIAFGAFVDIGAKNDGLVHISQIANRYVSDPKDEIEVGQRVKVKIIAIDPITGKIQLSMKDALSS